MRKILPFVYLLLFANFCFANTLRDTILLKEARVSSVKFNIEKPCISIDSIRKEQVEMQSLARFLQENTSLQFKTYGSSGSSVMSIRGANASQSKVIWNGMNIGSPMLNMNDVSLLSVADADEIELFKGGATAAQGSGALAGYIKLSTQQLYNSEKISFITDINQIHNQNYLLKFCKGTHRFSSSTSLNLINYQNKYSYANTSALGSPVQAQLNSAWQQFVIIQSLSYKFKSAEIEWHQWYQESDRELSPPTYNRMRSSYQLDKSYRSIANYKQLLNDKLTFNSSVGFTREQLRYVSRVKVNKNNLELFNSNSYFDQFQHQSALKFQSQKFSQEFLYHFNFDGAYIEDYAKYVKRYRLAIASISNFTIENKWSINWSNRVELLNNSKYFASSININVLAYAKIGFLPYIRLSKNYNLPGLNDMYWSPGGNPNLNAERSIEQELGLSYQYQYSKIKSKSNISVYNSLVRDWILWQPSAIENGVWTPQNLVEVKLQGLELEQEFKFTIDQKNSTRLTFFYAKTLAINNKAVNANDQSVGKQIIYIPEEKWGLNFNYQFLKTSINTNVHHISHRYTAADHSLFLPAYTIVDLRLQQSFEINKHQFSAAIYADNITNTVYESIPFQAMPARVFGINFKYQLNQLNQKKK